MSSPRERFEYADPSCEEKALVVRNRLLPDQDSHPPYVVPVKEGSSFSGTGKARRARRKLDRRSWVYRESRRVQEAKNRFARRD